MLELVWVHEHMYLWRSEGSYQEFPSSLFYFILPLWRGLPNSELPGTANVSSQLAQGILSSPHSSSIYLDSGVQTLALEFICLASALSTE